jgi:hypothetical protein
MWYVYIYREPTVRVTELLEVRFGTKHKAVRFHLATGEVDGYVGELAAVVQPRTVSPEMQVCGRCIAKYLAVSRGLIRGDPVSFPGGEDIPARLMAWEVAPTNRVGAFEMQSVSACAHVAMLGMEECCYQTSFPSD